MSASAIATGAVSGIVGRGVGYLAQYAFVAVCTRALGDQSAGTVLAVLSLVNIAAVVGRCGVDSCGLRDVSVSFGRNDLGLARKQALKVLALSGIVSATIATVTWVFRTFLLDAVGVIETNGEELLLLLIPLFTLTGVFGELLRALRRMFASAFAQLVLIYIIPVFILFPKLIGVHGNSFTVFMGLTVGAVFSLCFATIVFLRTTRAITDTPSKPASAGGHSKLFRGAGHFMVMSVTTMYLANVDVLAVSRYLGQADVAVYVACTRTAMAISLGLIGIGGILAPHFASAYSMKDATRLSGLVNAGARWCTFQGLIAATILLILAQPILSIFGDAFDQYIGVLAFLILGQFINSAFGPLAVLLSMTYREREGATILIVTAIVGTAAYLTMVPRFGLLGAAIANMSVVIVWNVSMAWLTWRRLKPDAHYLRIVIFVLLLIPAWFAGEVTEATLTLRLFVAGIISLSVAATAWFWVLHREDRTIAMQVLRPLAGFRRQTHIKKPGDKIE